MVTGLDKDTFTTTAKSILKSISFLLGLVDDLSVSSVEHWWSQIAHSWERLPSWNLYTSPHFQSIFALFISVENL